MNDKDWRKESKDLDQLLIENGIEFEKSYFYANGYNSPMEFLNRRNEVWKVKKE